MFSKIYIDIFWFIGLSLVKDNFELLIVLKLEFKVNLVFLRLSYELKGVKKCSSCIIWNF